MEKRCHPKTYLYFAMLLFLLPAVASEELLKSRETYVNNDTLMLNGTEYKVILASVDTEVALRKGNTFEVLNLENCFDTVSERLCYEDAGSNLSATLAIYERKPSLEVTISRNATPLMAGQERKVTINITNTGNIQARDVRFRILIPDGIMVTDVDGALMRGNKMMFEDRVDEGEEELIDLYYRPLALGNISMDVNLTYADVDEEFSPAIDDIEGHSMVPFNITHTIDPTILSLGDEVWVNISITNNLTCDNITVESVRLHGGEGYAQLEPSSYRSFRKVDSRRILTNRTMEVFTMIRVSGMIPRDPVVELLYEFEGREFDEGLLHYHIPLTTNITPPSVELDVPSHGYIAQNLTLSMQVHNPNPRLSIISVRGNVTSDLPRMSFPVSSTFTSYQYAVPASASPGMYDVRARGRFNDSMGNTYSFDQDASIEVMPLPKPRLSKDIRYPEEGGARILISLTNKAPLPMRNITVQETNEIVPPVTGSLSNLSVNATAEVISIPITLLTARQAPSSPVSNTTIIYSIGGETYVDTASSVIPLEKIITELTPQSPEDNRTNSSTGGEDNAADSSAMLPLIAGGAAVLILVIIGLAFWLTHRKPRTPEKKEPKEDKEASSSDDEGDEPARQPADTIETLLDKELRLEQELDEKLHYTDHPYEIDEAMDIEKEYEEVRKKLREEEG